MTEENSRRTDRPSFQDEAERGGRALGGGADDRTGGAVGRRSMSGSDYGSGYSGYGNLSGSFVDDYRGGPGSGGSLPSRPRRGSGLGAFGYDDDARREGSHRGRGPRNYTRSDERIREDLSDRLTDDPHIDASDIEIVVSGGEVTLTGHVRQRIDKRRAEDIAESVSGVRHVQNNLRIGAPNRDPQGGLNTLGGTGAQDGTTGALGPTGGTAARDAEDPAGRPSTRSR
jgi:hypothetical protein